MIIYIKKEDKMIEYQKFLCSHFHLLRDQKRLSTRYQYTKLLLLMTIKYSLDLNQGHDETKYVILGFRSLILLVLQAGTLSVEGTCTLL